MAWRQAWRETDVRRQTSAPPHLMAWRQARQLRCTERIGDPSTDGPGAWLHTTYLHNLCVIRCILVCRHHCNPKNISPWLKWLLSLTLTTTLPPFPPPFFLLLWLRLEKDAGIPPYVITRPRSPSLHSTKGILQKKRGKTFFLNFHKCLWCDTPLWHQGKSTYTWLNGDPAGCIPEILTSCNR
jgi:hypothetical protein